MTKNWKKFIAKEKLNYFGIKLQLTYPLSSIKDVQVTKKAFSSQKRISCNSKHEISYFFLLLWVILPSWIRIHGPDWIRIQLGPDPQPWMVPPSPSLVYNTCDKLIAPLRWCVSTWRRWTGWRRRRTSASPRRRRQSISLSSWVGLLCIVYSSSLAVIFYKCLPQKNDVNVPSKSKKAENRKTCFKKLVFCWRLEVQWRK